MPESARCVREAHRASPGMPMGKGREPSARLQLMLATYVPEMWERRPARIQGYKLRDGLWCLDLPTTKHSLCYRSWTWDSSLWGKHKAETKTPAGAGVDVNAIRGTLGSEFLACAGAIVAQEKRGLFELLDADLFNRTNNGFPKSLPHLLCHGHGPFQWSSSPMRTT